MINTFVLFSSYLNLSHLLIFIQIYLLLYFIFIISTLVSWLYCFFIALVLIFHCYLFRLVRMYELMLDHRLLFFWIIFSCIRMIFFFFYFGLIFLRLLFGHLNGLGVLLSLLIILYFSTSLVCGCFGLLFLSGILIGNC